MNQQCYLLNAGSIARRTQCYPTILDIAFPVRLISNFSLLRSWLKEILKFLFSIMKVLMATICFRSTLFRFLIASPICQASWLCFFTYSWYSPDLHTGWYIGLTSVKMPRLPCFHHRVEAGGQFWCLLRFHERYLRLPPRPFFQPEWSGKMICRPKYAFTSPSSSIVKKCFTIFSA